MIIGCDKIENNLYTFKFTSVVTPTDLKHLTDVPKILNATVNQDQLWDTLITKITNNKKKWLESVVITSPLVDQKQNCFISEPQCNQFSLIINISCKNCRNNKKDISAVISENIEKAFNNLRKAGYSLSSAEPTKSNKQFNTDSGADAPPPVN